MITQFLSGALAMAYLGIAVFFLRSWRRSNDRFFAFFAGAFALMAMERLPLLLAAVGNETQSYIYLIRLVGYLLIIFAILQKNRRRV